MAGDSAHTIDSCATTLHKLGWSCGDLSWRHAESSNWQTYAAKGSQRILVRGQSQTEVWEAACHQAIELSQLRRSDGGDDNA